MASTNKTTNYNLSQFVGTDKPAWLSDYNQDMTKIDTGIHTAATTATGADGKADANTTAIGTLSNLTTEAKTDLVSAINEVDTNANTAQGTANSAFSEASQASNRITAIENALNVSSVATCSVSAVNGTTSYPNIKCSTNTDKSLYKIYGQFVVTAAQNTTNCVVTITGTDLGSRDTEYNVEGGALSFKDNGNIDVVNFTVKTNGDITLSLPNFGTARNTRIYLPPILYFDKNFGD